MEIKRINKTYTYEQRSQDWFKVKEGKISSSGCDRIMKKRGLGVGGETYCMEITASILQQHFNPTYVSASMQQGIEREPIAKEIYEEEKMMKVKEAGFIVFYTDHPDLKILNGFLGVSPDGLIGEEGGLEVKCPEPNQHTSNLTQEVCHDKYYDQIQMCLFVTGRKWWDLLTFNPDFKDGYKWKITRIYPDKDWQGTFVQRAILCKKKVDETIKKIKEK